jgi:F-type H+-transporting ATPase subunit gamma
VGPTSAIRLLVITADRGLAGAYNSSSFSAQPSALSPRSLQAGRPAVDFVVVGKKGRDYFRRRPFKVVA